MIVRRAVVGDAAAIAHVHRSARAEAYGHMGPLRAIEDSAWAERLAAGEHDVFVADHDGAVVGFAAAEAPLLHALYVLPGVQGQGAGAALLRLAMKEGGAESLWVYSENAGARRFYERHGWSVVEGSEMTGDDWLPRAPAVEYRVRSLPSMSSRVGSLPESGSGGPRLAAGGSSGPRLPPVTVAVTDHAAERFLQRVGGALDAKAEIVRRVASAWQAGRVQEGEKATVRVSDERRRDVVYVCRWDRLRGELLVVTLWEEGGDAAVPRRYTDALTAFDRRPRPPRP